MKMTYFRSFVSIVLVMFPCVAFSARVCGIQHNEQYLYFCQPTGVNVLEKATGKWTAYTHQNGMLPVDTHCTINLHNDTLWVGSNDGWVTAICGDWKESKRYHLVIDDPSGSYFPVTKIRIDEQGRLALLFYYGVIIVDDGNLEYYYTPEIYSAYGGRLWDAAFGDAGSLWIAGDIHDMADDLSKYSIGGDIDYLLRRLERPWPFQLGAIRCVTVDAHHNVWFCPRNQLVKYDDETYTPYEIGTQVNDMSFDAQGRLWMAGMNGRLCCFENGEITHYPYQQETWNCLDIDGDIVYIGTQDGVLKFENGEFTPFEIPDLTTSITPLLAAPEKRLSSPMFTLGGTAVMSSSAKGVVISNGRKVVAK